MTTSPIRSMNTQKIASLYCAATLAFRINREAVEQRSTEWRSTPWVVLPQYVGGILIDLFALIQKFQIFLCHRKIGP